MANELTYFATLGYAGAMKKVVCLVSHEELNPGTVISKVIPFSKIIGFFERFEENRKKYLKILVKIS